MKCLNIVYLSMISIQKKNEFIDENRSNSWEINVSKNRAYV